MLPLDHPTGDRPHRIYVALTNHCNRSCPWCSTCSSPVGRTFLSDAAFRALLPREERFQLQLEGGEPTLHPQLRSMVDAARALPGCDRIILCTNGVVLPRPQPRLRDWLARLGAPLTLKVSVNHHLLDHDPGLLDLCHATRDALAALGGERLLVINVRLRRGIEDDDARVRQAVANAGLGDSANVFFLQAYGFAHGQAGWDSPFPVSDRFTLVNPDGQTFPPDLIRRSEAMRVLP
jgi:MoaA/NifB/PqqE/SkfB family radical SAM enzyme